MVIFWLSEVEKKEGGRGGWVLCDGVVVVR